MAKRKSRFVVVTTDKDRRGVFFGEFLSKDGNVVVLKDAQMAVYWPSSTRGVLGLAATGPTAGSRITPVIPQIELDGVTAVMNATCEAVTAWRSQPWS